MNESAYIQNTGWLQPFFWVLPASFFVLFLLLTMCDDLERIRFKSCLHALGIQDFPEQWWAKILQIHQLLVQKNQSINLTRITSFDNFLVKHILDSLFLIAVFPEFVHETLEVADVGCGPGFPGIPLALFSPKSRFTEIESSRKKVDFTNSVLKHLKLQNCRIVQGRAIELSRVSEFRMAFDLVLARAVKNTPYLIRECRNLLSRKKGIIVAYKTPAGLALEKPAIIREVQKYKLDFRFSPVLELPRNGGQRQFCLIATSVSLLDKLKIRWIEKF